MTLILQIFLFWMFCCFYLFECMSVRVWAYEYFCYRTGLCLKRSMTCHLNHSGRQKCLRLFITAPFEKEKGKKYSLRENFKRYILSYFYCRFQVLLGIGGSVNIDWSRRFNFASFATTYTVIFALCMLSVKRLHWVTDATAHLQRKHGINDPGRGKCLFTFPRFHL